MTPVLGPAGVLPPDPVGARVVRLSSPPPRYRGVVCSPVVDGLCDVDWRGATDDGWRDTDPVLVAKLCLDLSPPHNLDAGARALWHLLDLGEQPLTSPGWIAEGCCRWWLLDGERRRWFVQGGRPAFVDGDRGIAISAVPADDRQALALVLAAVAESRR